VARSLRLTLMSVYETLAISAPTVVDATLGRTCKARCDERLERWSSRVVKRTGMRLVVRGREHMVPNETYVVMSNHQSHYDVPVLFHVVGKNLRMVAKQELFRVPLFGTAMREAGFISVDRKNRESAIRSLEEAKPLLRGGTHIWIAPEGTRTVDGRIGPFKKGGFVLAEHLALRILPVTISGTRDALPSRAALTSPNALVKLTFHRPIDASGNNRDAVMRAVREAIQSVYP
jgi:1-acyl-sn-glycerol-3-phosphate acyltransferase